MSPRVDVHTRMVPQGPDLGTPEEGVLTERVPAARFARDGRLPPIGLRHKEPCSQTYGRTHGDDAQNQRTRRTPREEYFPAT